jgi:hypothetical protein
MSTSRDAREVRDVAPRQGHATPIAPRRPRPMIVRLVRPCRALLPLLLCWLAGLWLASAASAQGGETLYVAAGGTDPTCANGCPSLQTAINRASSDEASGAVDSVVIQVGPGVFVQDVTVPAGLQGLVIVGSGASTTQLSGDQNGSVMTIAAGDSVSIDYLSIVNGDAADGGGIDNQGHLTLAYVDVGGNRATGDASHYGGGGGVFNDGRTGASLVASDSAFVDNQANYAGGGVETTGYTYLIGDTISGNSVTGFALGGGGVFASGGGPVILASDTIVNNQVNFSTSDLSSSFGGGVLSYLGAQVTLSADTVAGNQAGTGTGLAVYGAAATVTATVMSNPGSDCYNYQSALTDGGYNLESDAGNCHFALRGVDPQLAPLADNGGQTNTEAIPATSPAYDAIPWSTGLCSDQDQRGVERLQRGAGGCDIGAYQVEAPTLYVANPAAQSITAYAAGSHSPVLTLSGASTGLSSPTAVLVDQNGRVYVANRAANSITEYAPEVDGNAAPVASIAGAATMLSQPQALALDAAGDLFVANANSKVTRFAPGANGNVAPTAVIAGGSTRLSNPQGLFFDASGNLNVSNATGTVTVYPPSAHGNSSPLRVLGHGALRGAHGLNFDGTGNLLVALKNANRIAELPAGATSTTKPTIALGGSASGLSGPTGLDFDTLGDLFVANSADNAVTEYSPGFGSNANPSSVITGPGTGLAAPSSLSELPPPPLMTVGVQAPHRLRLRALRSQRRLLAIVTARGARRAFHAQNVFVVLTVRLGRRTIATTQTWFKASGRRKLTLLLSPEGERTLRHTRAGTLTVLVRIVDDAGTQHRRIRIRLISG